MGVVANFSAWVRRTFSDSSPRAFNFETPAYSLLVKGMWGDRGRGTSLGSRREAMEIPAVLRGRNLICSISTLPLESVDAQNRVVDNPLLRQIDPNVANVVTLAQTVEDLLFDAVAWWRITGFDPMTGMPSRAIRMDPSQVSLQAPPNYMQGYLPSDLPTTGVVWMAGEPVPWSNVIRFDSPNPPLIEVARRIIERAIMLDASAGMYAENPRPQDYFTPADAVNGDPVQDEQIGELLDDWAAARRSHTTAYVPAALKYNTVQQPTPADLQLVQLLQRVSLEIANALGLDPEDLGISTTSRTYQNATDRRKDRINDVLSPYMSAITQRLSMEDVTPRVQRVRFKLDDYLRADPRTRAEVNQIYIAQGVTSREWVAADEGLPPEAVPEMTPAEAAEERKIILARPELHQGKARKKGRLIGPESEDPTLLDPAFPGLEDHDQDGIVGELAADRPSQLFRTEVY